MILVDEAASSASLLSYPPLGPSTSPSALGHLARLPSPSWSDTRADACFVGNGPHGDIRVGIEVKKVTELASSLRTGRLQATQLPGLLELYDVRWLVVVTGARRRGPNGELQTLHKLKGKQEKVWINFTIGSETIKFSYVHKFLSSPSFTEFRDNRGEGVRHVCVYNEAEAAAWIGDLYDTWQKPYAKHSSMRVLDKSGPSSEGRTAILHNPRLQDERYAQRVKTAASLPSIGLDRAMVLADQSESVREIIDPLCWCRKLRDTPEDRKAEEAWWSKGKRMGRKIAEGIGRAVR